MKRTKIKKLSPRANKLLLVLNIVLFLGAIVLAILNVDSRSQKAGILWSCAAATEAGVRRDEEKEDHLF